MDSQCLAGFPADAAEKVERLFDVLEEMTAHPSLRGRFAMYGGTAINLFMLDTPRLSVDIDVTYIGSPARDEMLAAKPEIEQAIGEAARALGYSLDVGTSEHAGRTFFLGYRGAHGLGNIKIDFTYLNRVPLFEINDRESPLRQDLFVPVLTDMELVGGKVKAFFSRVKMRDLYDIYSLGQTLSSIENESQRTLFHKVILYKASLSAAFPFGFKGRERRFEGRESELKAELYPMLRNRDCRPGLDELMCAAADFVGVWVLPRDEAEQVYLDCLVEADFKPDLLFGVGEVSAHAAVSPEAAWKVTNLKQMKR